MHDLRARTPVHLPLCHSSWLLLKINVPGSGGSAEKTKEVPSVSSDSESSDSESDSDQENATTSTSSTPHDECADEFR